MVHPTTRRVAPARSVLRRASARPGRELPAGVAAWAAIIKRVRETEAEHTPERTATRAGADKGADGAKEAGDAQ